MPEPPNRPKYQHSENQQHGHKAYRIPNTIRRATLGEAAAKSRLGARAVAPMAGRVKRGRHWHADNPPLKGAHRGRMTVTPNAPSSEPAEDRPLWNREDYPISRRIAYPALAAVGGFFYIWDPWNWNLQDTWAPLILISWVCTAAIIMLAAAVDRWRLRKRRSAPSAD